MFIERKKSKMYKTKTQFPSFSNPTSPTTLLLSVRTANSLVHFPPGLFPAHSAFTCALESFSTLFSNLAFSSPAASVFEDYVVFYSIDTPCFV